MPDQVRDDDHVIWREEELPSRIYACVTSLQQLIAEARTYGYEVTLDVEYYRVLDGSRAHEVGLAVKIAKLIAPNGEEMA